VDLPFCHTILILLRSCIQQFQVKVLVNRGYTFMTFELPMVNMKDVSPWVEEDTIDSY
jgi:hypothetical protein